MCMCDKCHYASKIPPCDFNWMSLSLACFKLLHTIKQLLNLTSEASTY